MDMKQKIQVSEIEMQVDDVEENLQDIIDTILCSATILEYRIGHIVERNGSKILLHCKPYCFSINFYYHQQDDKNKLHQIYITDSVDGEWNFEFRQKRFQACGDINSINGVGFVKPLDNFLKCLTLFDTKTGIFKEVGVIK
jgi:hypothetical protein